MSYSDPLPSFMPPPYTAGGDAIGVWPQNPMSNEQFDLHSQLEQQQPPFKKPRHSEDSQSNPSPYMPINSRMPINSTVNKGPSSIFFKTRVCAKFRVGACRNGENCNFAHGIEDLHQPPPNWQELVGARDEDRSSGNWDDDQKIIQKMKLCKKFYNGEECPYGERCNFLHEDPAKFKDDAGRFRESSAISIGTTGPPVGHGSVSNHSEVSNPVNNTSMKPVYWKTRLCTKWETTGHCPFGEKCYFAHGQAELRVIGERTEGEAGKIAPISTKPHAFAANDASPKKTVRGPILNEEVQGQKCLFKGKGPKKTNQIYADWIDDLPLVYNLPNQVES